MTTGSKTVSWPLITLAVPLIALALGVPQPHLLLKSQRPTNL